MLESKQHAAFWYYLPFYNPNFGNDRGKNILNLLIGLMRPEDTSGHEENQESVDIYPELCKIRINIKTMFWVATAVALPLIIGRIF